MYIMKGFSYSDLYNMPVYLRQFYIKELNKQIEMENKEIEKAKQGK